MDAVVYQTLEDLTGRLEFDPRELKKKYELERDKRILLEGNKQYVPTVDGKFADFAKDPWADDDFPRAPIVDHMEVIVAGGGFGGLLVGARLREAGFSDIRIIEEAGDFGGTWYDALADQLFHEQASEAWAHRVQRRTQLHEGRT
jgi:NADPH-dependent 2,4-dienoyl-CoA reductase/sulfur reductase-like enzyme